MVNRWFTMDNGGPSLVERVQYFHQVRFCVVDCGEVHVSIGRVVSQMWEDWSQIVLRESILIRGSMGSEQVVASECNNRRMRAFHANRWISACWIWFALSMIRCWVEFRILGNLSTSSSVVTIISDSLKIRASSGRLSMDITARGYRVMLFS